MLHPQHSFCAVSGTVPPIGGSTDRACRAGPVCPAAERHLLVSTDRLVPPCRAGACPRRRDAPSTILEVGAGIPDGPKWKCNMGASRMPRPTVGGTKKAAVRHPRWGGDGGLTADAVGIAPSADGALGRWGISRRARRGYFARCGGRVFRWLRPAGVSPVATGDRGRCPLDPCDFLKKIE